VTGIGLSTKEVRQFPNKLVCVVFE